MADWLQTAPDAARSYLEGKRLDEIECIISDLSGIARGKAMPASKFATQAQFFLPNSIFFQTMSGSVKPSSPAASPQSPVMVWKKIELGIGLYRILVYVRCCALKLVHGRSHLLHFLLLLI